MSKRRPKLEHVRIVRAQDGGPIIEVYIYDVHTGINAVPARIWQEGLAIHRRRWIRDVAALDHIVGRVDTASISGAGIKFKSFRWHDESVTSMLLDDLVRLEKKRSQDPRTFGQARANVVVKWNPADTSSISVWNEGGDARPDHGRQRAGPR
jgi:putative transposase